MSKITLGQARPVVARVLNLCVTDTTRIDDYINRAIERLMMEGDWLGLIGRYYINATENMLTLPRNLEGVRAYAVDDSPGQIRNRWYEFIESGPGLTTDLIMRSQLIDRGTAVAFDEVLGDGKYICAYSVGDESGKTIKLWFTDADNNPQQETLTLSTAGAYVMCTHTCKEGGLEHVVKDETLDMVHLYEHDPLTGNKRPLAYYEWNETVPQYRRYFVPGIEDYSSPIVLTIEAKKAYLPATDEDDPLLIQSVEAIRLACQAIAKEEKDLPDDAQIYWYGRFDERTGRRSMGAIPLLQQQLKNYQGPGQVVPIRVHNPSLFGAGSINSVR